MSDKIIALNAQAKADPPSRFTIGDTVVLNGDVCGVVMTVRKATKLVTHCDWHKQDGELQTADFPSAMLRHAEMDSGADLDEDDGDEAESVHQH